MRTILSEIELKLNFVAKDQEKKKELKKIEILS